MESIHKPQPIVCKAAVAYAANQPLVYEDITVAAPKAHEVRVKVIANALCHTDIYTLDGHDPEGIFPCILGHEATAVVESIGEGVTSLKVGDIVIPCYMSMCREYDCIYCSNNKTNLCPKVRSTQGKGLMPDGTTRFTNKDGKEIFHFMGCSTFSEYTVIAEVSAAKINESADLNKVCVLGCGVSTGWGAAINNTYVTPGSSVAVWGLGAVGLAVIQAAKLQGASRIYAIDINDKKEEIAKKFGADVFFNPKNGDAKEFLMNHEKWGVQFTYDCTGNVAVMRTALECAHRGFGQSCVIGVAASGKQIATRPFQLVTGRKWVGTAFGGWKSREDVPKLVNKVVAGEWKIDDYITHTFESLADVNQSIDALHSGDCLRAVIKINKAPETKKNEIKVTSSVKHFGGAIKTVKHWSETNQCEMTFQIYLPEDEVQKQRGKPFPVLYFLAGLTCNHENAPTKSGYGYFASKYRIAVVFPDTSPRNTGIEGINADWTWGESAGYYVNATNEKYKKNFNMFSYINEQLPRVVSQNFPVSFDNKSITGFSMGGHGALISGLKTGAFKSVSAFAPICHPSVSGWGAKAFEEFLGSAEAGKEYDSVELVRSGQFKKVPLFVEVGTSDSHHQYLHIKEFTDSAYKAGLKVLFKERAGYNHSFIYVASFIEEHMNFHSQFLNAWTPEL